MVALMGWIWKSVGMDRPGRPRDASVDQRVLTAVRELLASQGYAGLRIDEVAAASGVAKTTIYRRWPGLAHLVVAAMADLLGERALTPTGDPESDLRTACTVGLDSLRRGGEVVAGLALEVHRQSDPELRTAYRGTLIDPVREAIIESVRAGQQSGFFRPTDPQLVADALIGAAIYRLTILHEQLRDEDLEGLLDLVLAGLRVTEEDQPR